MYRNHKISVVMPCLNEEDGVKNVLGRMPDFVDEKVVCDNGSTDNTDALPARGAAVAVHACSRIGMQANPPRSTFSGWLRRR